MGFSKSWSSPALIGLRPASSFVLCLAFSLAQPAWAVPTFSEVRARTVPSEAVLYDRHDKVIHEQRINSRVRQLPWVSLAEISPILKKAILLSEDQRFAEHAGVDWKAVVSSTAENFFRKRPRGASTITMQLASLVERDWVPARSRRGWSQKFKQMRIARELEKSWTKDELFEAYLNLLPFRSEFRGVAAASYGLFGKSPDGLELREALVLAALVPSPQAPLPQVRNRACVLGKRLAQGGSFHCETLGDLFSTSGLQNLFIAPQIALAPHVAKRLLQAPTAVSTLDFRIQEFVTASLKRQVLALRGKNVRDAAALVVDNVTGDVLAYVGNVGELGSAYYVDGVVAKRQAGSTLKPFLYALAFEQRYLTPSSLVDDTAGDFPVQGGIYRPRNYDQEFHGSNISVRTALASSLNVPAVRVLNLVGVDYFVRKLKELGIQSLESPEFYGPSLALGSADITLWDLVNAYRVFANQGQWQELRLDRATHTELALRPRSVFSPEVSFLISDILSDRGSRSLTFGLDNPLAQQFWVAAKTGTSKDMRDNWCLGYSSRYTVGVWAGNFSGEPMWNVSGITGAAPAWSEIMRFLHQRVPSQPPVAPPGLVRVQQAGVWYLKGTEPASEGVRLATSSQVRITYPVEGTLIARDPDLPAEVQKVVFEHSPSSQNLQWRVGEQLLVPQSDQNLWALRPGKFHLSLVDAQGTVLDQVHFQVR